MTIGIADIGVYLPRLRLSREAIASAHAWAMPTLKSRATGSLATANWDEDSVTMAHEAARRIEGQFDSLHVCSTSLPFADRSHASLLLEALQQPAGTATQDSRASLRAATSPLLASLRKASAGDLLVAAEKRRAKPASIEEISYGDAAVAVLTGNDALLAEFVDGDTLATDFVDHYRSTGADFDYGFEERWIREEGYLKNLVAVIPALLQRNNIEPDQVARLVLNSTARIRASVAKATGLSNAETALAADTAVGDAGSAAPLLGLAESLEQAEDGDLILLVGFGQGCDAMLLRATGRKTRTFSDALDAGVDDDNYLRYLSHRELIAMDWGKRAERDVRTAQSAYYRQRDQVSGFVGGKCSVCGTVQFPRTRACVNPECRAFDTQEPYPFADLTGTVKSYTEDWQAFSPAPPLVYGNVGFDGGANILMQFTDTDAGETAVGDSVDMHFRIKDIDRARGFRRYFWKAIKERGAPSG
ncbi:MAG: 3-oxoacyl-[acyl-carrier-protein] synthase III C-terminal domain-containing protein [Woeseiaceae bacterium]|nr:3-oxoacyl-[acyl-carrier-protein] synthase III C-terminal domain-containing protein [Woeseiaceae bacterium]